MITWGYLSNWAWQNHYKHSRSQDSARSILKLLPIPEKTPAAAIDRAYLRKVVDDMRAKGLEESTIRRYLSVLMKTLREAHKEGMLAAMPSMPTLPPAKRGRVRWLTEAETATLMNVAYGEPQPFWQLLEILVNTGLRLGEALSLKWEDITADGLLVRESKNGEQRKIPMTKKVKALLETPTSLAGPFTSLKPYQVHRMWNSCRAKLGLDKDPEFVPHCLRHTFASRLVQRGAGLQVVKELLGHKKLENTMIYAHLAPAQHAAAISLLEN